MKHINYAIVPKTYTGIYAIHKYWARKPFNVVNKYIENYSKKGEIVLDPFVGSGITAIESLKLERKIVAFDINPMAIFMTEQSITHLNFDKLEKAYSKIENTIKNDILPK